MKITRKFDHSYFASLTKQTRRYGHCYVHAGAPHRFESGNVLFTVSPYGRSLQSGGHKYKVHARTAGGKPVPSKEL